MCRIGTFGFVEAVLVACLGLFFVVAATWKSTAKVVSISRKKMLALIADKKKPKVVYAMTSWCTTCMAGLPVLVRLHESYGDRVDFIGLTLDQKRPKAVQPMLKKADVDFPVYSCKEDLIDELDLSPIPMALLVKHGNIVDRITGEPNEIALEARIRWLLEDPES